MTSAACGATAISRGLEPARLMKAACPEIVPPEGIESTEVTPSTRVTAMCELCGLTAQMAATFGFMSPSSAVSRVPGAPEEISASPMFVPASIMPG